MEDVPKNLVSGITIYFMLAIELLICFIAPAVLFLQILGLVFPDVTNINSFVGNATWVETLAVLSVSVVIGILLSNIGDLILQQINKRMRFVEKAEDNFFDEFGSAHLSVFDLPGYIHSLSPEQVHELSSKSEKENAAYWDAMFDSVVKKAKEDTRRRLDQGKNLVPEMIVHGAPEFRRELRAYVSETESVFGFCRSVLPVLLFSALLLAYKTEGTVNVILVICSSFLIIYFWTRITIGVCGTLISKQLMVLIGLSYKAKLNQR